jgi:hypothetical protein
LGKIIKESKFVLHKRNDGKQ